MDNIGFTEGYIYRVHSISNVNITTGNISFTRRIEKDSRIEGGSPSIKWKTFVGQHGPRKR